MHPLPLADIHLHHIPKAFLDWLLAHPERTGATLGPLPGRPGSQWLTIGGRWPFPLNNRFHDAAVLAAEMERAGVARAALSPAPQTFCYWADPEITIAICRQVNDQLLAMARTYPARFWVLGQVPLNDPAAAAAELERCVASGAAGALIGTSVEGAMLTDPSLTPFWAAADRLGAVVYLHPLLGQGPGMDSLYLSNLLGNPTETAVAAAHLMLAGHLDRYTRVRLVLSHGGGSLPYQWGRLDFGFRVRPEAQGGAQQPPLQYLRRFWFDTVMWEPKALRFLVDLAGPDRVALGSDFPFLLTTWPHTDTLAALPAAALAEVAHGTAADLFGPPVR